LKRPACAGLSPLDRFSPSGGSVKKNGLQFHRNLLLALSLRHEEKMGNELGYAVMTASSLHRRQSHIAAGGSNNARTERVAHCYQL
jgi:hypothetical protein